MGANVPLMPNQKLMLNLKLMPMPPPGIMVDTMDTLDTTDMVMVWDTVDTTVDTMDTPTPTDTILARDLLMLKLNPGITDMVDTTDIHTGVTMDMPVPTMAVTGGNHRSFLSKLAKFYPPFELSTNHQLLPSKTLKYLFFFQERKKEFTNIRFGHEEFFCFLIRECAKYQHQTAHRL